MFGIEGDPTPEETDTISDAKHLIFEGMVKAVDAAWTPPPRACWWTSSSARRHPREAKERGLQLAMPVEKSGQNEFDFQYGDDFGQHIHDFDPAFSKVLVRYNPDGDAEMNERQNERLKRLADWLHENDRKFLFELLVPAEDHQLEQVGGDTDRYDAELRPELMRRAIEEIQDAGIEADIWKIEGIDTREDCERLAADPPRRPRRRGLRAARPRRRRREGRPLAAPGCARGGLRRLRDRPLDLVGRPEGVPRRQPRTRGRGQQIAENYLPLHPGLRRGGQTRRRRRSSRPGGGGGGAGAFRRPTKREEALGASRRNAHAAALAQFEAAFREGRRVGRPQRSPEQARGSSVPASPRRAAP